MRFSRNVLYKVFESDIQQGLVITPLDIHTIYTNACSYLDDLTHVTIPQTVEKIGPYACELLKAKAFELPVV